MAVKITSIEANLLDSNSNAFKRNIGCANPDATDKVLSTFTKKLFGLTDNTIVSISRIDKKDITAE